MFVLTWSIALQSQRPCLEQRVATIFYKYLATKLPIITNEDREFVIFDFGKSMTKEIEIKNIKCFVSQLYLWYILEGCNSDWRWLYMHVHEGGLKIRFLHFFFHLLLINVFSQCQTFYTLSQLQQKSLGANVSDLRHWIWTNFETISKP